MKAFSRLQNSPSSFWEKRWNNHQEVWLTSRQGLLSEKLRLYYMDKQKITVSRGPMKRKVLSYWKKPSTHNGSLFSHLLLWLCFALADAINRFVIWWWIWPLLKVLCCQKWVCPFFQPSCDSRWGKPKVLSLKVYFLRKVYFYCLVLLFHIWLVLELIQRSADYHHMSAKAFHQDSEQQMVYSETTELLWKWKEEKFQRNCVPF